jgi:hypothetical protein
MVPPNEDAANSNFIANGLFTLPATSTTGTSTIFSMGDQTLGSFGGGAIVVQPGASIVATHGSSGTGGSYVALLGPSVSNLGSITTQNGQIILGAGASIGITEPLSTATGVNTAFTVAVGQQGPSRLPRLRAAQS